MKQIINYEEFAKMDLRVGKIIACERKEESEKLLRLKVDFGEEGVRNILSGIAAFYTCEDLTGKEFIFILNLEPRKIMNELSEGMILATSGEKPILIKPLEQAPPGSSLL